MDKGLGVKLFFRIGIVGEKGVFRLYRDRYSGVVIGAHFVAFYNEWTPTFLRNLEKPFFVDPVTYAFARDIQNINMTKLEVPTIQMISTCWECGRKLFSEPEFIQPTSTVVPLCYECYEWFVKRAGNVSYCDDGGG